MEGGIPRLLDPEALGLEAKLRELAAWPELAREQGWYEADDRIDAALPFLCRDLGWDDTAWRATERGFVGGGLRGAAGSSPRSTRGRARPTAAAKTPTRSMRRSSGSTSTSTRSGRISSR